MRFTGWICSLLFACSAFAAHANDCISQTEMSEIAASFPQFRSLAGAEYCLDDSPTAHLLGGIMFMRQTRFAPDMPKSNDDLFSGRFASSWWDYFIGRINEFQVEGSCAKGVVAYVYWFGNTMYVCPMALTANMTALDLASVFMHEARHIDGFPHTTCTHGPRQGLQGACDSRISQGGSYAVTVETYAQLAKYAPDIHPAMRAYSRSSAAIYANEAFETPVRVDLRTQYLIMTDDGEFHELNVVGETATKLAGHAPAVGQIFMRGQHMILYPQDKNLPAKFVFAHDEGDIPTAAGDIAVEYNGLTPALRAEWRGVHIGAQWSAKVRTTDVTFACDPRSASTRVLQTGGETPVSTVYPEGYDRGSYRAHLIMESGRIFEMGCAGTSPYLRESTLRFDVPLKRIHKVGNDTLGLGVDGRVYRLVGTTATPIATELDGRIHDLVPMYAMDFFDL